MVDTGSVVTIISRRLFNRIPLSRRPPQRQPNEPVKLKVANNELMEIDGVADMKFVAGNEHFEWRMYIAPIQEDGLVGMDFLYYNDYALGAKTGLKLNGKKIHTVKNVDAMGALRVVAASRQLIPARSQLIMEGLSTTGNLGTTFAVVEPCPHGQADVFVGRALVDVHQSGGTVPVRLLNLSNSDVTIQKGTAIASLYAVSSVLPAGDSEAAGTQRQMGQDSLSLKGSTWPDTVTRLYQRSSTGLNDTEREQLCRLLDKHVGLFAKSPTDLGRTAVVEHKIDTGDARPIKQAPRRLPRAFAKEESELIQKQLEAGVIRKSSSPWSSPMVYVKKKDGTIRPCVDYRRLNQVTVKDAYPLPSIQACLDSLAEATTYSTLDLQSGYWQITVREEDRCKTAFAASSGGLFEYVTMPMGLCNGPSTFERAMELILSGLQWRTLLVYLDDIIIFATSAQEMMLRMDEVFSRLSQAGLKLKADKCHLFQEQVRFLGHTVSKNGIGPDPEKVQAIHEWPRPRNVTDVRAFLGLCSYYRRYIRGFSEKARPLFKLLEAGEVFQWTSECESAFQNLKGVLSGNEVLAYPRDEGLYILDTDASNVGIGATISQMQWCDLTQRLEERPIAYASKTLTKSQRRYCVTRRELMAVVTFMQQFRHYLLGRKFLVRTDHSALRWVMSFKEPQDQMARWMEILSQFDFEIEHRPGKKHGNADALSRVSL